MKILFEEEKTIAKHHSGGYREYRIPGILPVKNGLLLTFEARNGEGENNLGDWGDIDIIVLKMEFGKDPVMVLKIGESHLPADGTMRTYNNPVLIPDEDQVHLIYHKNYDDVFCITSKDGGLTWSEPRDIKGDYRKFPWEWTVSATGPGHGVQMKNGRLVAPVWIAQGELKEDGTRRHRPSCAGSVYSDDHGLTWNAGALVPAVHDANETCVVVLEDGRLLFNYRNRNEKKLRVLGLSSDGGKTIERIWAPEELQDPGCFAAMAVCKEGILFSNCNDTQARENLTVKCSKDCGDTWEVVGDVAPVAGYSDIAVVGEDVYVFYERKDYSLNMIGEILLKKGKIVSE